MDIKNTLKPKNNKNKKRPKLTSISDELSEGSNPFCDPNQDTSDEEELRNHVGNIPHEWYDEFEHFGYTIEGNKIKKFVNDSKIDDFLNSIDDPNNWRKLYDKTTGKYHELNDDDAKLLEKIEHGKYPSLSFNPYENYIDWFTGEEQVLPINRAPVPKRSFLPSLHERRKVLRLVKAIKEGKINITANKRSKNESSYYSIWNVSQNDENQLLTKAMRWRKHMNWPIPRLSLPGTADSYNPPPEYLPDENEIKKWQNMDEEERQNKVLPTKYNNLRSVPAFDKFLREKFDRCLDIYLCPRQKKLRIIADPEDLIPKLPSLADLKPFPSWESMRFVGHSDKITCIDVNQTGEFLVSGDKSGILIFWETSTSRKRLEVKVSEERISSLDWSSSHHGLLLVSCGKEIHVLSSKYVVGSHTTELDVQILKSLSEKDFENKICTWGTAEDVCMENSDTITHSKLTVYHPQTCVKTKWHNGGDYFLSVIHLENNRYNIIIHQLSKKRSQTPFAKSIATLVDAYFHPSKPILFVATSKKVFTFNLMKQIVLKTYISGVQSISSMAIHPGGDNFVIGSTDKKICWFDMDLATTPYKKYKFSKSTINDVAFHNSYPLLASANADGNTTILHAKVFQDLIQNPQIIPIKQLKTECNKAVVACCWHPTRAWIFIVTKDNMIRLFI